MLFGITAVAAILLFILGALISFPLLNLTVSITGARLIALGPLEPAQAWIATGILFTSCGLWAMILYLVHFRTHSTSFSMSWYSIYLATSIMGALAGIGFRLLYLSTFSAGISLAIGQLQFLRWGFIADFLVCGLVTALLIISRSAQPKISLS